MNRISDYQERPASEQLVDLHVYVMPQNLWRKHLHSAVNEAITEMISAGFVRVLPEMKVVDLRHEIENQLGPDYIPGDYVFLKSVGRCLTQVKGKQELSMKVKSFLPPQAYCPEIFLLEATPEVLLLGQDTPRSQNDRPRTYSQTSGHSFKTKNKRKSHQSRNGYSNMQRELKYSERSDSIGHDQGRGSYGRHANHDDVSPSRATQTEEKGTSYFPDVSQHAVLQNEIDPLHSKPVFSESLPQISSLHEKTLNSLQRVMSASLSISESDLHVSVAKKQFISPIQEQTHSDPTLNRNILASLSNSDSLPQKNSSLTLPDGTVNILTSVGASDQIDELVLKSIHLEDRHVTGLSLKSSNGDHPAIDTYSNMPSVNSYAKKRLQHEASLSINNREKEASNIGNNITEPNEFTDESKNMRNYSEPRELDLNGGQSPENESPLPQAYNSPRNTSFLPPLSATPPPVEHHATTTHQLPRKTKVLKVRDSADTNQSNVDSGISDPTPDHFRRDVTKDPLDRRKVLSNRHKDADKRDDRNKTDDDNDWDDDEDDDSRTPEVANLPSPPALQLEREYTLESEGRHDSDSARQKRLTERQGLMAELDKAREDRKEQERKREELVRKAKLLQNKTNNRRNQARDVWKKRYFEEKKKTPPLEEQCNRHRHEIEVLHRRLLAQLEHQGKQEGKKSSKGAAPGPSVHNNYKIQATKLQHDRDELRRRVENSKMKLTAEMKLRNQAETELRALRAELTQKKINVTLNRSQQMAALGSSHEFYSPVTPGLTPR